jgi:hypothetical protein
MLWMVDELMTLRPTLPAFPYRRLAYDQVDLRSWSRR